MKQQLQRSAPPPMIDPTRIGNDEVLRFVYDENGNLVAIYKEPKHTGCLILVLLIAAALVYCYT